MGNSIIFQLIKGDKLDKLRC